MKKILRIFLVITAIIGMGMVTVSVSQVAYAKPKMSMKSFPKSIRGTWYSYQLQKMYKYKITSKKIVSTDFTERIHSRKVKHVVNANAKIIHPSWVEADMIRLENNKPWVNVRGWYLTMGMGDGSYYRKITHKVAGTKHSVLLMGGKASFGSGDAHAYHSKNLARKYSNHY